MRPPGRGRRGRHERPGQALLTRGIPTSGSELREWPALAALKALGGTIYRTHQPSNLDGVDTVVYSTAIPRTTSSWSPPASAGCG